MVATEQEHKIGLRLGRHSLEGVSLRQLAGNPYSRLALLIFAAGLLILTIFLPYWQITLYAPQYPKGLKVEAYVNRLSGDVREVDGLNHYIGMMKLNDAAKIERTISRVAIPVIGALAVLAFWLPGRWKWVAISPFLIYPFAFMADLFIWLYHAGHSLDPHAALSNSIRPFTPHIFGVGRIGQFHTEATFAIGFYIALLGAVLTVIAVIAERRRERAAG